MPVVILDQVHWAQLEQVQSQVESKVAYVSDMQRFGVPDWWEPAVKTGDCEDIALAKRKRLMEMGWPADALRIAVLIDGRGELHAVLTVDVVSERGAPGTYVLDSHFTHVEPWKRLNAYGYTWLERSKPGSSQWSRLDSGTAAETTRIASLSTMVMPASPRWVEGERQMAAAAPAVQVRAQASAVAHYDAVSAAPRAVLQLARAEAQDLAFAQTADLDDEDVDVGPASLKVTRVSVRHGAAHHHSHKHNHARHGRRSA